MKTMLLACVVSLCPVAPGSAGPFEDGVRAAEHGDYAMALRRRRLPAEQGESACTNHGFDQNKHWRSQHELLKIGLIPYDFRCAEAIC